MQVIVLREAAAPIGILHEEGGAAGSTASVALLQVPPPGPEANSPPPNVGAGPIIALLLPTLNPIPKI